MTGAGMQKGLFFKSFEFIEKVSEAKSTEETAAALAELAKSYGCSTYILASFDDPGTLDDPYVLSSGWDPEWSDRYFGNSYVKDDPVVARALHSPEPFVWSDTRSDPSTNARGRQILDEAAAFRMSDGVFIPVHGPGGLAGSLAFGSEDLDLSPDDNKELLLAGFFAYRHALELAKPEGEPFDAGALITNRERECLKWTASGLTSSEIADKLNISRHTADWYLKEAARKLGAANRIHSVAIALRLGIIG